MNFIKVLRYFCYFSQSLINLLITGKAVSNVWDNDKEVCGLSKYSYLLNVKQDKQTIIWCGRDLIEVDQKLILMSNTEILFKFCS